MERRNHVRRFGRWGLVVGLLWYSSQESQWHPLHATVIPQNTQQTTAETPPSDSRFSRALEAKKGQAYVEGSDADPLVKKRRQSLLQDGVYAAVAGSLRSQLTDLLGQSVHVLNAQFAIQLLRFRYLSVLVGYEGRGLSSSFADSDSQADAFRLESYGPSYELVLFPEYTFYSSLGLYTGNRGTLRNRPLDDAGQALATEFSSLRWTEFYGQVFYRWSPDYHLSFGLTSYDWRATKFADEDRGSGLSITLGIRATNM